MEFVALGLFLAGLGGCIFAGIEVLYALVLGLVWFTGYCLLKGYALKDVGSMLTEGMAQVANILIIFVLIGSLTALWRICGTIPFILYHAMGLINPRFFVLCTFMLCSVMSFLTGTSFGTASTMGVICMLISNAAGLDPLLTGGAILSGIFFGDRCSPMSSSAQLVCVLTKTDIYENIKSMCRTSVVPLILSSILYVVLSGAMEGASVDMSLVALFKDNFSLHWVTFLPALLILVLAVCHVDVKYAMAASIAGAVIISMVYQGRGFRELMVCMWEGYQAEEGSRLAVLLNGGGILSMVEVGLIVLISASYAGIFSRTPLLSGVKAALMRTSRIVTPFGTVVITSLLSCAVSCNQSLATILTCQMCDKLYARREELALAMENTVIVLAALIPWGIAGAVPVATIGAPMECLLYAFYLYLLPAWNLVIAFKHDGPRGGRTEVPVRG